MKADLKLEWQLFLLAVQFLTRLPVPRDLPWSDDLVIRSTKYYPAVGCLVGVIGAAVLWLGALWLPMGVAVLLSLAATLLVSGAMHEDGLADAADGLVGGATRERALEIMRDSRIGSYGALALGVVLALKVALLAAMPVGLAGALLVAAHGLGRMASVHVIATTDYARPHGTKFPVPTITRDGYRVALATAVLILVGLTLVAGLVVALCAFAGCTLLAQAFRLYFIKRLGGYTGDCLGGAEQMGELGALLAVALWL